jgi:pyrroloquinoline quinone (PQQ) biosynthesis protein C
MVKMQTKFEAIIATEEKNFLLEHQNKSTAHPGHTMESTTYLLIDKDGKETAISLRYFIYW